MLLAIYMLALVAGMRPELHDGLGRGLDLVTASAGSEAALGSSFNLECCRKTCAWNGNICSSWPLYDAADKHAWVSECCATESWDENQFEDIAKNTMKPICKAVKKKHAAVQKDLLSHDEQWEQDKALEEQLQQASNVAPGSDGGLDEPRGTTGPTHGLERLQELRASEAQRGCSEFLDRMLRKQAEAEARAKKQYPLLTSAVEFCSDLMNFSYEETKKPSKELPNGLQKVKEHATCRPCTDHKGLMSLGKCGKICQEEGYQLVLHSTLGDQNCKCASKGCREAPDDTWGGVIYNISDRVEDAPELLEEVALSELDRGEVICQKVLSGRLRQGKQWAKEAAEPSQEDGLHDYGRLQDLEDLKPDDPDRPAWEMSLKEVCKDECQELVHGIRSNMDFMVGDVQNTSFAESCADRLSLAQIGWSRLWRPTFSAVVRTLAAGTGGPACCGRSSPRRKRASGSPSAAQSSTSSRGHLARGCACPR